MPAEVLGSREKMKKFLRGLPLVTANLDQCKSQSDRFNMSIKHSRSHFNDLSRKLRQIPSFPFDLTK